MYCTTSNLLTANALSPDISLPKAHFFRQLVLRDSTDSVAKEWFPSVSVGRI